MALDDLTNQYLTSELTQTISQLQGVEAAIASYTAQKNALQLKIAALKTIDGFALPPEVPAVPPPPPPPPNPARVVGATLVMRASDQGSDQNSHAGEFDAKAGFRDAIREVLRNSSRGMRARDVLNALHTAGFKPGGNSDPAIRVATELYRMTKSGQIKKRGNLHYALDPIQGG